MLLKILLLLIQPHCQSNKADLEPWACAFSQVIKFGFLILCKCIQKQNKTKQKRWLLLKSMENREVVMVFNSWVELRLLWTICATAFVLGVTSYWNIEQPKPTYKAKQNKNNCLQMSQWIWKWWYYVAWLWYSLVFFTWGYQRSVIYSGVILGRFRFYKCCFSTCNCSVIIF